MTIDHIGLAVRDYPRAKRFYTAALAPLGVSLVMEVHGWSGFGSRGKPEFWLGQGDPPQQPMHIAFRAASREQVRQFHQAALAADGRDNGAPGLREIYHPHYYGAFVIDPDGHNVEAVCHEPE